MFEPVVSAPVFLRISMAGNGGSKSISKLVGVGLVSCVLRDTTRVGAKLTVVIVVAVLLLRFGSLVAAATVAMFVIVPGALAATVTTISTVAVTPLGKMPRLHVTVLVPAQVPELGVAETNVTPFGRVSVRVTPLVVAGIVGIPLFVTVKW